jgi:hypothetical protein
MEVASISGGWQTDEVTVAGEGKGSIAGNEQGILYLPDAVEIPEDAGVYTFSAMLDVDISEPVEIRYFVSSHQSSPQDITTEATVDLDFVRVDGEDGDLAELATLVFLPHQGPNQTLTFDVAIIDDWLQEATERFDVSFEVLTPAYRDVIDVESFVTDNGHSIIDNDFAEVTFQQHVDGNSALPSGFEATGRLEFDVTLSHFVYTDVTVTLFTQEKAGLFSATSGVDYTEVATTVVRFPGSPDVPVATPDGDTQHLDVLLANDNVQEVPETFSLMANQVVVVGATDYTLNLMSDSHYSLTEIGTATLGDIEVAVGTIYDDEGTTAVVNSGAINEGDYFTFEVTLSHPLAYPIAVDVSLIGYGANDDLHAVEGLNYPASWGTTLNFAPAEISARTVTVETIENSVLQPEVQFQLHVEPSYNFITTAEGQGVVTILLDTESAHLHVVAEDFVEGQAPSMQVHVDVVGGDDQTPVQVEPGFTWEYHTDSLTAVAGDDFEDTSGSVTFASLDFVHFDFGVTVVDDHLVETTEHFDLHLDMVETWLDFGIDMEGVYPVPIHDQENAVLTVDASRAWEDSGEMIFTVFLSHGLEGDFQLQYHTLTADESECNDRTCPAWDAGRPVSGGVASIDGKDFEPVVDGLTDVMTGDGTPKQHFFINVDIVDDYVAEVQEYFFLEVTGVVPGYVFEIANPASGTIGDREMATVSIVDRTVINEDIGTVTLDVTLSHRAQPDVVVTYRTYAGTANDHVYNGQTQVFNKDFEPVTAGIITFKSAFTPNLVDYVQTQLQQIDITIVDDHVLEEDEQFCVTLGDQLAPADVSVYVPRSGRDGWVELQHDREHVTVSITDATTLNEAGELNFAITLSHGVESADVDVRWRTQSAQSAIAVGGASPNGADFVMVPQGVTTIPRSIGGGMTEFATVQSIDDPVSEGVETFEVALVDIGPIVAADSTGVNGPIVPNLEETIYVTPGTIAVGYISDLEKGIPVLSIRDDEDEEGSTFEFVVDLDMPIDEDLLIHYTTAISSNTQFGRDVDFQEGDITIAAGAYSNTIRITLPENNIVQPLRTFFVDITLPVVSHVVFGQSRATGTITDNDKALLSMHSATFWEGTAPSMQFEVRSDRLIELAVPFMWTTSGTAGIEVDGNQAAVFPSQSFNAYVEVTVTNDNIQESDETFQLLGLSIEPQGQNVEWGSAQATGTIMDDEGATISIIDQQTTEDVGGNFRFEVKLSHKVSRDYTAMYRISDVTFFNEGQSPAGTADFDNLQRDGVVTFAVCSACDGGPVADILLHVEDDQIAEYTEAVQIEIINPLAPITVAKGSAYFTIVDNDFATLEIAAAEGFETDGAMRFQVTLSHELAEDTSFKFETVPSSLVPTLGYGYATGEGTPLISQSMLYQPDYLLKTEDIVLRQKGNAEFIVELLDDTEQELDEIFMVRATGSDLLHGQVFEGTGAIINDDEGVEMSAVEFATDDDGHTTFTVTLSHAVDTSELSILLESADPLVVSATYTDAVAPHTTPVTLTGHIDVTEYDSVIDHIPVTVAATLPSGLFITASTEVLVEPNHHRISPLAPIAMADLCSHGAHGKYEDDSHLEVHVHPGVKALIELEDCFFDANYNDHQFVLVSDADESNVYIEDGILHIDDVSEELELSVFASDSAGEAELHIHIHFEELEPVSLAHFSMNGMTVHHGMIHHALINRVMGDADCEVDSEVADSTCEVAGDGEVHVMIEGTGTGNTKLCVGEESAANCGTVTVPVPPAAVATKGLLFAVDGDVVYYPLHIFGGKPDAFGHYYVHCHAQGAASDVTYKLGVVSALVTEGDSAILCVVNDQAGAQSTSTVTIRALARC